MDTLVIPAPVAQVPMVVCTAVIPGTVQVPGIVTALRGTQEVDPPAQHVA